MEFSDPYGSWKTTWISLVSSRRRRGVACAMSSPSNRTVPAATGTTPSTALPTVVFPDPLSPTSASVSPAAMSRSTPSTAVVCRRPRP